MTLSFEAGVLPRLPKVRSYLRPIQFGQLREADVTHRFASTLQEAARVDQISAAVEHQGDVSSKYGDAANAVGDHPVRRAVQQNDLRTH